MLKEQLGCLVSWIVVHISQKQKKQQVLNPRFPSLAVCVLLFSADWSQEDASLQGQAVGQRANALESLTFDFHFSTEMIFSLGGNRWP